MSEPAKTWLEDPTQLSAVADAVDREFAPLDAETANYLRYYYDRPVIEGRADAAHPMAREMVADVLRRASAPNLTREAIDAFVAIVCREMRCRVTPIGVGHALQLGCKQASRLIEGVFDNCDFDEVATRVVVDGCTTPVGVAKGIFDAQTKEIRFERVDPLCFRWVEDWTGNPRTMFDCSAVPVESLCARYPEHADKIRRMRRWEPKRIVGVDVPARRELHTVRVVDAYARALGDKHPGRHVVAVGDIVLEDEPWPYDILPYVTFRFDNEWRGFGGISAARILNKYDAANRRMMRMVYAGLSAALPQVLEHEDTEFEGFTDVEFARATWRGTHKPELIIPQAVSPDVLRRLEANEAKAYAELGLNSSLAAGAAPARYTSAVAQREFVDISNTRLLDKQKRIARLWRDAGKVVIVLSQHARGELRALAKGATYYEAAKWPKLPADKFKISFGLASGLSLTPAGRIQDLTDLKALGLPMDNADLARAVGLPDTQQMADRLNAPRELVLRQVSLALEEGKFDMPSVLQGEQLHALVTIGGQEYQRARLEGTYPPAHLEVLRRLIKAAQQRLAPPVPFPSPANDNLASDAAGQPTAAAEAVPVGAGV